MWSLGITAIELALGDAPHSNEEPMKALRLIVHAEPPTLPSIAPPGVTWSFTYRAFIAACLKKDQKERPSVEQLFKGHAAFFAQAKDEAYVKEHFLKQLKPVEERVGQDLVKAGDDFRAMLSQQKS